MCGLSQMLQFWKVLIIQYSTVLFHRYLETGHCAQVGPTDVSGPVVPGCGCCCPLCLRELEPGSLLFFLAGCLLAFSLRPWPPFLLFCPSGQGVLRTVHLRVSLVSEQVVWSPPGAWSTLRVRSSDPFRKPHSFLFLEQGPHGDHSLISHCAGLPHSMVLLAAVEPSGQAG